MSTVGDIVYDTSRPMAHATGLFFSTGAKFLYRWYGLPLAVGVPALLSQWDHVHEKENIKDQYQNEIAARLNINPRSVSIRDMERVAEENPALQDAVRRSRWKRNLNISVTAISMIGAFALAAAVVPLLPAVLGGALASTLASAAISFGTYALSEFILTRVGEQQFGLAAPAMDEVQRDPRRQSELSVSDQIRYIETLQRAKAPVLPTQLFSVYVAGNEQLAADIAARYGKPYGALAQAQREQVAAEMGPVFNLTAVTDDINARRVRAQELAFLVSGQSSGVARSEVPYVTALERMNVGLQQQLNIAHEKINDLGSQVKDKAVHAGEAVSAGAKIAVNKGRAALDGAKNKLGFAKSDVALAIPANQNTARVVTEQSTGVRATGSDDTVSQVQRLAARAQKPVLESGMVAG